MWHCCEKCKEDNTTSVWHYRTLLEFHPSTLSIQNIFTICEIRAGRKKEKNKKEEKNPLDTTEVLAKSIYKVCHFLVNMNQDKQRCSVVCFIKHLFFFNISQHEVGEQCLNSCKNKCLITRLGNIVCNGHTRTLLFHCQNSIEGESKKEKKLTKP